MSLDYRDEWLVNLGQRVGLPTLSFDDDRVCQLQLDDELTITFHKPEDTARLVILGQLHISPVSLTFEAAKEMLKRNRSNARLSAPVISLSPEEDAIEIHLVLDEQELLHKEGIIDTVIEELEHWRQSDRVTDRQSNESAPFNATFV